jgi:hypothetical protein
VVFQAVRVVFGLRKTLRKALPTDLFFALGLGHVLCMGVVVDE